MLAYFILILLPLVISQIDRHFVTSTASNRELRAKKNNCNTVFFTILIIMLSLRDVTCGADLSNYKLMFISSSAQTFREIIEIHKFEQVYYELNKLVSLFGDFQVFLAVCAILSLLPIAVFYKRESVNPYLTVILFAAVAPFSIFFSGLRQALAMAFTFPAWNFAKNKKILWFLLMVLLATLFHQSSLILLLLYPLYHVKFTKKWLLIIVPIMISCFVFKNTVFGFLLTFVGERYFDMYGMANETGAYSMLFLFIIFAVFAYVVIDEDKADKETLAMRNVLLCTIFIQFFASLNTVAMRFNYYFLLFLPVFIPKVIYYAKKKYSQVATLASYVMSIFFTVYFFIDGYTGADILKIFPYVPFWKG